MSNGALVNTWLTFRPFATPDSGAPDAVSCASARPVSRTTSRRLIPASPPMAHKGVSGPAIVPTTHMKQATSALPIWLNDSLRPIRAI